MEDPKPRKVTIRFSESLYHELAQKLLTEGKKFQTVGEALFIQYLLGEGAPGRVTPANPRHERLHRLLDFLLEQGGKHLRAIENNMELLGFAAVVMRLGDMTEDRAARELDLFLRRGPRTLPRLEENAG